MLKKVVAMLARLPSLEYNGSNFKKGDSRRVYLRFKWGQIQTSRLWSMIYSIPHESQKDCGEDVAHMSIAMLGINLTVHTPDRFYSDKEKYNESRWYGFFLHPFDSDYRNISVYWSGKCSIFDMPWTWHHVRHEKYGEKSDYPFYDRHNNQTITATVQYEEREFRWKWLTFLPFPRILNKYLEIEFSDGYGPRVKTSWKGGTIGCSFPINKGESIVDCLKRNEKEYK